VVSKKENHGCDQLSERVQVLTINEECRKVVVLAHGCYLTDFSNLYCPPSLSLTIEYRTPLKFSFIRGIIITNKYDKISSFSEIIVLSSLLLNLQCGIPFLKVDLWNDKEEVKDLADRSLCPTNFFPKLGHFLFLCSYTFHITPVDI
jgi:hypothetical protein